MDTRQEQLLTLVVETHITTAEPVGSKNLVETAGLNWSEATVRNELRFLEEAGFLTHPHTSAGRVPTIAGYQYYIQHNDLNAIEATKLESALLAKAAATVLDYELSRKQIAKTVVELSKETVLIAFSPERVYYTGLANLFQKPDFANLNMVVDISQVFDQCDKYLPDFFDDVTREPQFYFGDAHPFGALLSVLSMRFGKNSESVFMLLGPQRMDYKHNWGLIKKVQEII